LDLDLSLDRIISRFPFVKQPTPRGLAKRRIPSTLDIDIHPF